MNVTDVSYLTETPAHDAAIEEINAEAFGPGRFARAAYKIREGGPHERALSRVAVHDGRVIASVRLTRIAAGAGRSLLLGPLAVIPACKNLGIGKRLVAMSIEAAREAGIDSVILVGDEPYYGPLGFRRVPYRRLVMPRPVDPNRLLIHEIASGALEALSGNVIHADLARLDAVPVTEAAARPAV